MNKENAATPERLALLEEIATLAMRCRAAQKSYFRSRAQTVLVEAKIIEKELDAALEPLIELETSQLPEGYSPTDPLSTHDPDALTDDDLMTFGVNNGRRLGDVPDDYWRWFLSQDWCDNHPELVAYANNVDGVGE